MRETIVMLMVVKKLSRDCHGSRTRFLVVKQGYIYLCEIDLLVIFYQVIGHPNRGELLMVGALFHRPFRYGLDPI